MKTACIIPAYNEEKTIAEVIERAKSFVDEIIVVDDGSIDQTAEIIVKHKATLLRHIINRGQGAALETGNEYALKNHYDIIVHFDADGQFKADEIPEFVKLIESGGYDVVLGSRFMEKKSNMPFMKKYIIMPIARIINNIFFNIKLTDPQNGFRALSARAAEKIKIEQSDWAHCSEILAKVFAYNLKYKEIPVTVNYSRFGRNFSSGFKIIKDLLIGKLI